MRMRTTILLLFLAIIFMMAGDVRPFSERYSTMEMTVSKPRVMSFNLVK